MSQWAKWVVDAAGTDVTTAIARETGINQSSVYRWLNEGAAPSPAHAAQVAQTFHRDVLEAFVAAGFLTAEEAGLEDPLGKRIRRLEHNVENARKQLYFAQHELTQALEEMATRNAPVSEGEVNSEPVGSSRAYRRVADLRAAVAVEFEGESAARLEATLFDLLCAVADAEGEGHLDSSAVDSLLDAAMVSNDRSASYYADVFAGIAALVKDRRLPK